MFRRGEPVPFAFVAEADRFRSNVTPPPRERATRVQLAGRILATVTVVASLVGAVVLGMPALEVHQPGTTGQHSATAAQHR
ncbi:hypothetical protein [Streptomyces sp. RPT161]|uniref:hypothetical protein n=1 Tax=Streptomyces sp. RPT161 TaxID=3015993 RepID=UPI0022B8D6D3|nr:hypothetical protein [Streptomyces sp. RPT161]